MKIVERRYICKNGVVEKTRFLVGDRTRTFKGIRRKNRVNARSENEASAVRVLAQVLNCNFTKGDLWLSMDYDEEGLKKLEAGAREGESIKEAADRNLDNWLRRLMRKNKGMELKRVVATSDMDGETGELTRLHHHVVISKGISFDQLRKEWKSGTISIRELRDQADYTPIALYIVKQVKNRDKNKRGFRCSRNMEKAIIEDRFVSGNNEIQVPKGAKVLERQYNQETVSQYVRYVDTDYIKRMEERRKC